MSPLGDASCASKGGDSVGHLLEGQGHELLDNVAQRPARFSNVNIATGRGRGCPTGCGSNQTLLVVEVTEYHGGNGVGSRLPDLARQKTRGLQRASRTRHGGISVRINWRGEAKPAKWQKSYTKARQVLLQPGPARGFHCIDGSP